MGIIFTGGSIPQTVLILDPINRHSPYVTAVLQVSILNGTDLKTMINYTGEQVSQRTPEIWRNLLSYHGSLFPQSVQAKNISSRPSSLLVSWSHFAVCHKVKLLRKMCSGSTS